jgi:hypothetical protein
MKTALCLSGFPRCIEYSYPYLHKYLISELNPDIYFYGYSDVDRGLDEGKIIDILKPKDFVIRKFDEGVQDEIWSVYGTDQIINVDLNIVPMNILSQYYNMFNSNKLKSNSGVEYDLVIRARTDYFFYRKIDSSELNLSENTVYIPNVWDFEGVSSGFAYGDSKSMDIYSDLFNHMRDYNTVQGVRFHQESLKGFHIRKHLKREVVLNHYWWDLQDFATNNFQDSYINDVRNPSRRLWI